MVVVAALVAATVLVIMIVTGLGTPSYKVHAEFTDASQLVKGNVVQVSGRTVGKVTKLKLEDNGNALVEMTLDDDTVDPLHRGTRATIRALGLSGVANRFIDISPGPASAAEIEDGGTIDADHTKGVVDLDVVLNSLDPEVRKDIQGILRDAANALTPKTAKQVNKGIHLLNPAVAQLTNLGAELTRDQRALESLLVHSSSVAAVLARHRQALGSGIESTAGVLTAIATEREALSTALASAPQAITQTTGTLRRLRTQTLPALDPVVEKAQPTVKPFGDLLRLTEPTLTNATPVVASLRKLVPQARAALLPLPRLEKQARPAVGATSEGLKAALPLITGLRAYTPELVSGFFSGFGGNSAHTYDANGHYARVSLQVGAGGLPGIFPIPTGATLGGYRNGVDARCPGSAEEPGPDGSNPWIDPTAKGLCDPEDNHR